MAGGLTVSVRQIASYPQATISPNDLLLVQTGGLGGPYASSTAYDLVAGALLSGGSLGIGVAVPPTALGNQLFSVNTAVVNDGARYWNAYTSAPGPWSYWNAGAAGADGFDGTVGFDWQIAPVGQAGQVIQPTSWQNLMRLDPAGALSLNRGTLTVARDPASALEVATMGWVGAQTVASFNGRKGVVTLSAADIYAALGICPPDQIATCSSVNQAICAAIQDLLQTYPAVWSWMGRVGDVFLTVADMNFAAANNPPFMPPLTIPAPPQTATDGEVVNAQWVIQYLTDLTTTGDFATKQYVDAAVAASVVSFNGRTGTVNLSLADVTSVGGAPSANPNFSGVPTAPTAAVGSSTSQLATTAFVMAAVSSATAGVASFNGRTGIVTLNSTDINNAGGALLASPNLTGTPTAPTAAAGNSSTQLATTAFVSNALAGFSGVTSFNTRTGAVTLQLADVTGVGGAPLASPALTGTPTAPTAAAGTDNTQVATTAFVVSAIAGIGPGVTSFEGRTGAITLQANDISAAGGLINPSVALTGVPTAPTATAGTSSTQIATTAFVGAAILGGTVTTFNGRSGAVTLSGGDITGAGGALTASPTFTGVPIAPTAPAGTSSGQIATTAFVTGALATQAANSVTSFNGRQGVVTLTTADITAAGGAPIASPTFTGVPQGPTATAGTSSQQLATTAFVMAAIAASTAGVTSFNSRTGAVTLQANDVSAVGGALLASPNFTGSPTSPTPAPGDNSTNIATTAFVMNALSASAVTSFNTRTGAVTLTLGDVTGVGGAPLASPNFTGTPTVPTAPGGTSTGQAASTQFVATAIGSAPFGTKNYVDNSGFLLNQRAYASGTALAAGVYGLDRWKAGSGGCTLTFTASPAATILTITAGSLQQVIEGAAMLGQPYTLSWVGSAQGRIATTSGGGTYGASPVQFTGAANTNTFIEFTGGTLTRVQLQLGSVATTWQPLAVAEETLRCQRFLTVLNFSFGGYLAANNTTSMVLPVNMRALPTASFSNVSVGGVCTGFNIVGANTNAFTVTIQVSGAGNWTASATWIFSADL